MKFSRFLKTAVAIAVFYLGGYSPAIAEPWSFGVISDTQWTAADDGKNPNTVAADIIQQIDREFIAKKVRFVIAVGDTVDKSNKTSIDTRALYAQDLYNEGIAFYPLRGNHEANAIDSGVEFGRVFPQIGTGLNNATPADVVAAAIIPKADMAANPPAIKTGTAFTLGKSFSAPATNAQYHSLTYSFDYKNARFVLLDQFDNTGHTKNSTIAAQQDWIFSTLSDPQRPQHAFVFAHKPYLAGHKDNLFGDHTGSDPGDADPARQPAQNLFLASLANNRVHFFVSGHDHHHSESMVTSPDGKSSVLQIICASDSSFFFPSHPQSANNEKVISRDFNKIGYYLFTIDGTHVTMDYYGVEVKGGSITTTPQLTGNWVKISTSTFELEEKIKP